MAICCAWCSPRLSFGGDILCNLTDENDGCVSIDWCSCESSNDASISWSIVCLRPSVALLAAFAAASAALFEAIVADCKRNLNVKCRSFFKEL